MKRTRVTTWSLKRGRPRGATQAGPTPQPLVRQDKRTTPEARKASPLHPGDFYEAKVQAWELPTCALPDMPMGMVTVPLGLRCSHSNSAEHALLGRGEAEEGGLSRRGSAKDGKGEAAARPRNAFPPAERNPLLPTAPLLRLLLVPVLVQCPLCSTSKQERLPRQRLLCRHNVRCSEESKS